MGSRKGTKRGERTRLPEQKPGFSRFSEWLHEGKMRKRMAFKPKDIRHLMRQEQARGRRKPVRDLDDVEREKRFKQDILDLLRTVERREDFIKELKKLTARYGRQVASEQFGLALRAFDEYWSQRRKPLR